MENNKANAHLKIGLLLQQVVMPVLKPQQPLDTVLYNANVSNFLS